MGCEDIGNRKSEFVAKTQFLSQSNNLTEYSPQPLIFQYLFLWNLTVFTKLVCKDKRITKLDFDAWWIKLGSKYNNVVAQ